MTTDGTPLEADAQIRVLLADDHPLYRSGVRTMLEHEPDIDLVGEAEDGDQAVGLARTLRPQVVLMDLHMPGCNGIEATARILAADPEIRVLVLTMLNDDESLMAAVRAGARGYLLKDAGRTEVLRSLRDVAAGQAVFGPEVAQRVLTALTRLPARLPAPFPELTQREREILVLLAQGRGTATIAQALFLAPKTVRNNISAILAKLGAQNRDQAAQMARAQGLGI